VGDRIVLSREIDGKNGKGYSINTQRRIFNGRVNGEQ